MSLKPTPIGLDFRCLKHLGEDDYLHPVNPFFRKWSGTVVALQQIHFESILTASSSPGVATSAKRIVGDSIAEGMTTSELWSKQRPVLLSRSVVGNRIHAALFDDETLFEPAHCIDAT